MEGWFPAEGDYPELWIRARGAPTERETDWWRTTNWWRLLSEEEMRGMSYAVDQVPIQNDATLFLYERWSLLAALFNHPHGLYGSPEE